MNRFFNKFCPVCRSRFNETADVVVCPICGTPHHRSCYEIKGACALEGLHAEGFVWNGSLPDEKDESFPRDRTKPFPENTETESASASESVGAGADMNDEFSMFGEIDPSFAEFMRRMRDPALGEDGVSMKELTTYASTSVFHYGRAFDIFRRPVGGKKRRVFINFCSGILAPVFQFYRKMDLFGALVSIVLLMPIAGAAFFPHIFLESQLVSYLFSLLSLAELILLSAFGDYIYYRHAVKRILKIRSEFGEKAQSDEYFAALSRDGRPSYLRAFLGVAVLLLCSWLISLAANRPLFEAYIF